MSPPATKPSIAALLVTVIVTILTTQIIGPVVTGWVAGPSDIRQLADKIESLRKELEMQRAYDQRDLQNLDTYIRATSAEVRHLDTRVTTLESKYRPNAN
jgi:sensor histidine kinase YesM